MLMNVKRKIVAFSVLSTILCAPALVSPSVKAATMPTMQDGSSGQDVKIMQRDLNLLGFSVGVVDGQFGPLTQHAVEEFQQAYHLPVTGIMDAKSWGVLETAVQAASTKTTNSASPGSGEAKSTNSTPSTEKSAATNPVSVKPKIHNLRKTFIYFNGRLTAQPYAFTYSGTTYMPIWYLQHMLAVLGIHSTWNGKQWSLTVPAVMSLNVSDVKAGQGLQSILMNGTLVQQLTGIAYPDVYSHKMTEYMPIWYLQRAMLRIGIKYQWNGSKWTMTQSTQAAYQAFDKNGTQLGTFMSLTSAKAAIANQPGAVIKDASGKVVFSEPSLPTVITYTAYTATGSVIGTYKTILMAEAAVANQPGATVENSAGKLVFTEPQSVTYVVYDFAGSEASIYQSLSAAKSAISANPGYYVKDSNNKLVYTQSIPYAAYSATGSLLNVYSSLSTAELALVNYPGAMVKDDTGKVVYTQPSTAGYNAFSSTGMLLGAYSQLSQAEQAVAGQAGAMVQTAEGTTLYTEASTVSYSVYSQAGQLSGTYPTLLAAETAAYTVPGGCVEDGAGNVLYIQPLTVNYLAYNATGGLIGVYASLADAKQAAQSIPGGSVQNGEGTTVYGQAGWDQGSGSSQGSGQGSGSGSSSGSSPSGSSGSSSPAPTSTGFPNVDLRFAAPSDITANTINSYLNYHNSPLAGLGSIFMQAQSTYGVDANYLVSHAILESSWGKSQIAQAKNNIYGYGAYDSNPGVDAGRFPSLEYAILYQAWSVRNNYLTPGAGLYVSPTLTGMNVHYATDPHWANSIGLLMSELASYVGDTVKSYKQYTPSNVAPTPSSTQEPIFQMDGAKAVIQSTSMYGNLPYYSNWTTGESQMFVRTLQSGDIGGDVATLQLALNQKDNAGLAIDGVFGPLTQAAVSNYQKSLGMTPTGQCDYSLWKSLVATPAAFIPANSTVTVDSIAQGLAGGLVIPWYHIANYGWVDSEFVHFTNVYRLEDANATTAAGGMIPVYSSTNPSQPVASLHAGDFVVSNNATPTSGMIQIQFVNEQTGQAVVGLVNASTVQLTAVQ